MVTEKLLFICPEFSEVDTQVTVRNERKWDEIVGHLPIIVDVYKTGDEERKLGRAIIVGKMVVYGDEIPDWVLAQEHSPSCRSQEGLLEAMRAAYGSDWRPGDHEVTILFFDYVAGDKI